MTVMRRVGAGSEDYCPTVCVLLDCHSFSACSGDDQLFLSCSTECSMQFWLSLWKKNDHERLGPQYLESLHCNFYYLPSMLSSWFLYQQAQHCVAQLYAFATWPSVLKWLSEVADSSSGPLNNKLVYRVYRLSHERYSLIVARIHASLKMLLISCRTVKQLMVLFLVHTRQKLR